MKELTAFTCSQRHRRQYAQKKGYRFGTRYKDRMVVYFDERTERTEAFEKALEKDGFTVLADPSAFREVKAIHDYYIINFN